MTQNRSALPQEAACLYRPYRSSQKGGTLIAEDVRDFETHKRRLATPDGYRPSCCPSCYHPVLHVHDYRSRLLQLVAMLVVVQVVRHRCMGCGARWQTLPAFLARHLWFNWPVVQQACEAAAAAEAGKPFEVQKRPVIKATRGPSRRTVLRWLGRLHCCARRLSQLLASSAEASLVAVAQQLGLEVKRSEVVAALGRPMWAVAALIHRLMPGVRLM